MKGSGNLTDYAAFRRYVGSTVYALKNWTPVSGNNQTQDITGNYPNTTALDIRIWSSHGTCSPSLIGSVLIKSMEIRGTGVNPFAEDGSHDAADQQAALDEAFDDIRDALQTDPEADIDTLVADYQDIIETAFGVTFSKEITTPQVADDWGLIALHFAHLGLEATAEAFERWVEAEIVNQYLCQSVDRYALFRRITGGLELKNVANEASNAALTTGKTISINRIPDGNRQWIMTPNNLIHEIGHSLDNSSGFGTAKIGSIQYTIDDVSAGGGSSLHNGFTRDGIGPSYLRVQFYEHARVEDTNNDGVAEFNTAALNNLPPSNFDPSGYLLYDLFSSIFDLWDSSYNIYRVINMNARIDPFGINTEASPVETVADSVPQLGAKCISVRQLRSELDTILCG